MSSQKYFNYEFSRTKVSDNFFVNPTNKKAYDLTILKNFNQNIFLYGPEKSGKSHLVSIWKKKNNAIFYDKNFSNINNIKNNIIIDDVFKHTSEEELFHLINNFLLNNFDTISIQPNNFLF